MDFEVVKSATNMTDVMGGADRWHIQVSEFGFVDLVDVMPRLVPEGKTADAAIVQAARVSYGVGTKTVNEDRGLVRYLMRHRHTTPLEMVEFKFHCSMPIFIARQWIRHRTANVNEMSGRYSVLPNKFFKPQVDDLRAQSKTNKQGRDVLLDETTTQEFLDWLDKADETYAEYERFIEKGVARELARMNLPINIFTEWYWKIDAHNLFHFLSLRMDKHAQKEIQDYAKPMFEMVRKVIPDAAEAFIDYKLEGMFLSKLEVEAIKNGMDLNCSNKREAAEWELKKKKLIPDPKAT